MRESKRTPLPLRELTSWSRSRLAFTLIELLVVIAVIGILFAILLPALQSVRGAARSTACAANMKQMATALHSYQQSHDTLPSAVVGQIATDLLHTWLVMLLPHLEQNKIYDDYNFDLRYNHAANATVVGTQIGSYLCPASDDREWFKDGFAANNYAGSSGSEPGKTEGVLYPGSMIRGVDIKDGSANTVVFGEIYFHNIGWARGAASGTEGGGGGAAGGFARGVTRWWRCASPCARPGFNPWKSNCQSRCEQRFQFSSNHSGGAFFAFADTHVEFLSSSMDAEVFRQMITRDGGELPRN